MIIRKATKEDLSGLEFLAIKFIGASPYTNLPIANIKTNFEKALDDPKFLILIAVEDKEDAGYGGFMVGVLTPLLFSDAIAASELAWWVDPWCRKSHVGLQMHQMFEQWAIENKSTVLSMVLLEDVNLEFIDKMYKNLGYEPTERSYMKVL